MTIPIHAAVATQLRATPKVTALLGGTPTQSIILAGRLAEELSNATPLPVIAIQDGGVAGNPRQLPFAAQIINLYVVDQVKSPNTLSYLTIDKIIEECIEALHKQPLTVVQSYYGFLEIQYDNYIGPDAWNDILKLPYKIVRFRAYTVRNRYV